MTSSKHPKTDTRDNPLKSDLDRNPGIGQSKGAFAATGADPREIEGENTVEGDIENDPGVTSGVNPDRMGRTNK